MHFQQANDEASTLQSTPTTARSSSGLNKRMRTMRGPLLAIAAAASLAWMPSAADALSSQAVTKSRRAVAPASLSDEAIARQLPSTVREPMIRYYEEDDDEDYEVPNGEYEISQRSLEAFQLLQESAGSEILESTLQRQIDDSVATPDQFLEKHMAGATMLEKVAMASITEQLPQRAVQAFNRESSASKTTTTTTTTLKHKNSKPTSSLNNAGARVSREQEIHLARIIQQGVVLHNLRSQAESKADQSLSRQEWADLAGISAKELRRRVSDYRKAKQDLVTSNLGLVHAVVNQQWPNYRKFGFTKEELVQEGSLGLLRAAELFDPERGLRFSTYATIWTKASLSNSHMTELVRLPSREKTKWNKIVRAHKDLEDAGEKTTVKELAAATGMTFEEVLATQRKMSQAQRVLSLDYEYDSQSRSGMESRSVNTMENDKALQQDADLSERTQLHADVVAAMARNLDAREARLVRLRYGLSDGRVRSLRECAEAMGLSQTRVQQLSQKCLKKLRQAAEAESLEEYLLTIA